MSRPIRPHEISFIDVTVRPRRYLEVCGCPVGELDDNFCSHCGASVRPMHVRIIVDTWMSNKWFRMVDGTYTTKGVFCLDA